MSSLWTPSGDVPVPGPGDGHDDASDDEIDDDFGHDLDGDLDDEQLDELEASMAQELAAARARLAEVPASQVVANHVMGLFELGAIHLSQSPANLPEAALAIDAMAALIDGLGQRLGEHHRVLTDALAQIRLAFVQVKAAQSPSP